MTKKAARLLQARLLGVTRAHFWYAGFFAIAIVVYDATHLVPRENIAQRWMAAVVLLIASTVVWYLVRAADRPDSFYVALVNALVITDILFAGVMIYLDRGMASRNVALFAIPITVSAILNSRSAIFAAAAMSTAVYVFAATKYFYDYFNEGYKAELYAVLFFYSASFFVLAGIVWAIMRYQKLS
ncbi:MAG TPA: hypothetical protein VLF87_02310 [Patescibacteria group bacterium]|nr:hypothetical protein [Patescibacteria group bacterium]